MSEYDEQSAVHETAPGEYTTELYDGWRVGGGINGGYLLGILGRALRASAPDKPDPLVVSAHYVGPSTAGPATVHTRMVREGRSVATLAADLEQGSGATITALATMGRLDGLPDDVGTTAAEPVLPPRQECVPTSMAPEEFVRVAPIVHRMELLLDPASAGWAVGEPSGRGVMQGWFRLPGREPDPISLLTVVDALPPVTFDLGRLGWAPTLELTAHVRGVPAPGWLKVRLQTRNVAGGMFEEDCEVWDSAGRLVAQSRQLARQPR